MFEDRLYLARIGFLDVWNGKGNSDFVDTPYNFAVRLFVVVLVNLRRKL
jgi:hypothetical protein